jgi:ubiquinol-cytochrome c reductase iron-sulfur subunit
MSDMIEKLEHGPVADPGLPEHQYRPTDVYPDLEKRAERQIAAMFGLAALLSVGFCVAYFTIDEEQTFLGWSAMNFALGSTLGSALLLIGTGIIRWAKQLMGDHEIVEMRHASASSNEDRADALAALNAGLDESGIARRPLIRNSLIGAVGALGLPAVVALRDLGPLPHGHRNTVWRKGMRVVNDVSGTPIKPADLEVGQLVNAEPEAFFEVDEHGEHVMHGAELLAAKSKAAVIVVRMRPEAIRQPRGRENWGIDGILCYSKICTHVGCPISLWEQQTHHLLCPCHQSTFDLGNSGLVVFGPAARALPQLAITIDDEGYLVARRGFDVPTGPSFFERDSRRDFKEGDN